jgi:hypothetical protein
MLRLASMAATAALLLSADVTGVIQAKPSSHRPVEFPPSANLQVLPDMHPVREQTQALRTSDELSHPVSGEPRKTTDGTAKKSKKRPEPLQPESRLALIRYVDGEFVRVVSPLPAGKKGFHLNAGKPLDQDALRMALASNGAAVNPGDAAQITRLEFKDREIVVDINGGGGGKTRLRDRIHFEIGGIPTMRVADPVPTVKKNVGATLYLDFGEPLPDMTPDQLKKFLGGMLDFSKHHSAAVQWIDTLPPKMQKAIQKKQAVVGMDREMVLAAMGRPGHKVRERDDQGIETEDWIYGYPPAKTVFVKFEGEKVISVEQFPK